MFFNPYTGKFGDGSLQGFHRSLAGLGDASDLNSVACPMDAKICPDGTTVGRVPPGCSFAPCPSASATAPGFVDGFKAAFSAPVESLKAVPNLLSQHTAFHLGLAAPALIVAVAVVGFVFVKKGRG